MSKAQEIYQTWFDKKGHQHSEAFAKGVLFWLKRRTGEDKGLPQFPYRIATPEYDAWDAGIAKGWELFKLASPQTQSA